MVTGVTGGVVVVGVELGWEGGVTREVVVGLYMGTDEIGFPMTGAVGDTGEGGLVIIVGSGIIGL